MIDVEAMFEKHANEFLKFRRVENKLHARPDVCAFLLIDKLCPGTEDIVVVAEHDQIFLSADVEDLAKAATEEDIVTLIRCGVRIDDDNSGLAMFV